MTSKWTRSETEQALAIEAEHGAAEASKATGIPAATIRSWRHKGIAAGDVSQPQPPRKRGPELGQVERIEASLNATQSRYDQLIADGKYGEAKSLAVPIGILVDKLLLLRREGEQGELVPRTADGKLALAQQQGELIFQVLSGVLVDLGLEHSAAAKEVVRDRIARVLADDPKLPGDRRERILAMQEKLAQGRRDRLRVKLESVSDPLVSGWWITHLSGCLRCEGQVGPPGSWRPPPSPPPELDAKYVRVFGQGGDAPVRKPAPVAIVRDDLPLKPLDEPDDEPEEPEPEVDALPLLRRPRRGPAVGASQFPTGSVQRKLGGWRGPAG